LKAKKQEIQAKSQSFMATRKNALETNQRIETETKKVARTVIAQFERKLFLIEKFNKKKIDMLDESVNKMFSL
jgi:predicted  nucleic acid-binding Zn-ribbon protein